MSIRESRLCDSPGGLHNASGLCSQPAQTTCPVCKQDRCTFHMGTNEIKIAVTREHATHRFVDGPDKYKTESIPDGNPIGFAVFKMCETCLRERIENLNVDALCEPTQAVLAAHITAKTLAPVEPKK